MGLVQGRSLPVVLPVVVHVLVLDGVGLPGSP
jgi:hypothetical protein